MTVSEDFFLQLRNEYPELDAEVRAILLSRAKHGATIADIKMDYYDRVGIPFPVYEHIIEYLLSITNISAICNESGTLIFNILPSENTKHLYELVVKQKDSKNQGQHMYGEQWKKPRISKPILNNREEYYYNQVISNDIFQNYNQNFVEPIDKNMSYENSEFVGTNEAMDVDPYINDVSNSCYEDNCLHFFDRFHSFNNEHQSPNRVYNNEHYTDNTYHNQLNTVSKNMYQFKNNLNNKNSNLKTFPKQCEDGFKVPMRQSMSSLASGTKSSRYSSSIYKYDEHFNANLLGIPILGDDLLMFMARMELKCKFIKRNGVLKSGFCMSGQSISMALRNIERLPVTEMSIIINLGSVDIMQGKTLLQMQHDYRKLLIEIRRKGIRPILTTLAPLANYAYDNQMKRKLERFNEFIKRESHYDQVVDIWSCLVNDRGHALFDCFQSEPRPVTGTSEAYLFWNKIGRQRVLQLLKSSIEF